MLKHSMKLSVVTGACLSRLVTGVILSSKETPPPPAYPIGQTNEAFAKVSGRLFDINGTVGYFSG